MYKERELTLEETAQAIGSKGYTLSHAINRYLDTTFNDYVNRFWLEKAHRLLAEAKSGRMTIDKVGFKDRKSFFRVCKRLTGMSPDTTTTTAVTNLGARISDIA